MTNEYVSHVIDGDTFETEGNRPAVRLADVDTPEEGEPGYHEAKNRLEELILSKWVGIEFREYGVYDRRIADVWVNGTHVNEVMKDYAR